MAANESELGKLHEDTATCFREMVKAHKEGRELLSPQMWNQITKFMKDNDITCDEDRSEDLQALRQGIQEGSKMPFNPEEMGEHLIN